MSAARITLCLWMRTAPVLSRRPSFRRPLTTRYELLSEGLLTDLLGILWYVGRFHDITYIYRP